MSTRYELLYIIPTTFTDEEAGTVETKVSGLLTKVGATTESTKRLGKLRLAYPIENQRHGYYVLVMFTAEKSAIAKLEENLRITSEVLRHLILRADEAGSNQKFDLVQFTEVNVETKDDRPRRRDNKVMTKEDAKEEGKDIKSTAAALHDGGTEKVVPTVGKEMSSEELEKKIASALSADLSDV